MAEWQKEGPQKIGRSYLEDARRKIQAMSKEERVVKFEELTERLGLDDRFLREMDVLREATEQVISVCSTGELEEGVTPHGLLVRTLEGYAVYLFTQMLSQGFEVADLQSFVDGFKMGMDVGAQVERTT